MSKDTHFIGQPPVRGWKVALYHWLHDNNAVLHHTQWRWSQFQARQEEGRHQGSPCDTIWRVGSAITPDGLVEMIISRVRFTKDVITHISRMIELLFKQLKQNFPLKYFYGESVNAIESQIWVCLIANLLLTVVNRKVKRRWAFSNLITAVRQMLMYYVNIFSFLENPERTWQKIDEYRCRDAAEQLEMCFW